MVLGGSGVLLGGSGVGLGGSGVVLGSSGWFWVVLPLEIKDRNFRNCSSQEIDGHAPLSRDMLIFDSHVYFLRRVYLHEKQPALFHSHAGCVFLVRVSIFCSVFFS